jgi:hypothetical protein
MAIYRKQALDASDAESAQRAQEKNKEHRPQAWKGQLAQEMIEAAVEAAVEKAMRISADPLPVGAGNWQGCEGNGDEEGTAD